MKHAYPRYVLAVLSGVYTLSMTDQGLMFLLLQPIKEDLKLSDTQLGFLTGVAFAVFYAVLALPVARWADRGNRSTIASLAIGLWGMTVTLSLLVTNFAQLVAARVATSVGGAGCMPPTYSLLGDYFAAPSQRTRAMTIFTSANAMSLFLSFLAGGWLNEHYGWRISFAVIGVPGLLIAVLVKATVKEPRSRLKVSAEPLPDMVEILRALWRQNSARHLAIALILVFTLGFGLAPWYAAFMMRNHQMGTAELGLWMGLVLGFGGIAGTMLGGYAADRWFSADERGQMRLVAASMVALVPCLAVFLLLPQKRYALMAFVPYTLLLNIFFGPTFAVLQRLVVDEMRATTLALIMLLCNLIGMSIGPQLVGILSDRLTPLVGGDSLRWAMLIVSLCAFWAAYHFWQIGRTVRVDLAATELG